ncbi:MAG TPA: hypothetical protein VNY53_17450, partial [Bradyrhizobium sp.]|nr:hypothetical protein [Bradyrhizobium sp.]
MPIPTVRMASDREKLLGVATLNRQVEIEWRLSWEQANGCARIDDPQKQPRPAGHHEQARGCGEGQ